MRAGAAAIGMGSKLITNQLVKAGDFEGIARQVAQVIEWIRQTR